MFRNLHVSSTSIYFLFLLIFVFPGIYQILTVKTPLFLRIGGIRIENAWLVSMIILILSFLFFLLSVFLGLLAKRMRNAFCLDLSVVSRGLLCSISSIYVVVGMLAALKINLLLDSFNLYFIEPGKIGVIYGELNVFRYYILLFLFPIGLYYLFYDRYDFRDRFFVTVLSLFFLVLIWFTTRREQVLLNLIFLFFYYNKFKFSFRFRSVFLAVISVVLLTYFQLKLRGVSFSEGIGSIEDFSPVSLGGYLIEKWMFFPFFIDNSISYLYGIVDGLSSLGVNEAIQSHLGGGWNNPTLGFFALFFITGFLPATLLYIAYSASIDYFSTDSIYNKSYTSSILVPFLILRFLLFLRNGELFNAFLDNVFFFIFLLPFFFGQRLYK